MKRPKQRDMLDLRVLWHCMDCEKPSFFTEMHFVVAHKQAEGHRRYDLYEDHENMSLVEKPGESLLAPANGEP